MKKTVETIKKAKALQKETATLAKTIITANEVWEFLDSLFGENWETRKNNRRTLLYSEVDKLCHELLVPCRAKSQQPVAIAHGTFYREGHENFAGNYQSVDFEVFEDRDEIILYLEEVYHTEYCVDYHSERTYAAVIPSKEALFKDELKYEKLQRELLELTKSRLIRLFV